MALLRRSARHTPVPDTRETARSVEMPPAKTTIFMENQNLSFICCKSAGHRIIFRKFVKQCTGIPPVFSGSRSMQSV